MPDPSVPHLSVASAPKYMSGSWQSSELSEAEAEVVDECLSSYDVLVDSVVSLSQQPENL